MHTSKAIWDGHAEAAGNANWEVDFASSPIVTGSATFGIKLGDNAVDVAKNLTAAWNSGNPGFPATRHGVVVTFASLDVNHQIIGMRFTVLNTPRGSVRLPGDRAEVEVVNGLHVHRELVPDDLDSLA